MRRDGTSKVRWWMLPLVVLALPLVLVLVIMALLVQFVASCGLHLAAWCWWSARGRDVLFVYSDSPVWKSYIETEILPVIEGRAVVLNWSERSQWRYGLATAVFRYFGGREQFNPMAVVFRPFRRASVFRFWQPFRDWKHGQVGPLQEMQDDLFALIEMEGDKTAA